MIARITAASAAAALVAVAPAAVAAGPWTVQAPGGITWQAPHACTLTLDLATWDGYPARVDVSQAYELVVVRRNGVEIGRTADLDDRVAQASRSTRVTATVAAGDIVTVVHSSLAGLADGTPNSVSVSASFGCPTPPSTTTTPATTVTVPASTTTTSVPTTSTVAVDTPPVPTATTSSVPTSSTSSTSTTSTSVAVGTPPVPGRPTAAPPLLLPETGVGSVALFAAAVGADLAFVGALLRRVARRRW